MQRFGLKKLNNAELKEQYQVNILKTDLQLWKTWMIMWTPVGLGMILEREYI
jgi:hypothetical protein